MTWSATDPGSGVKRYKLQVSVDGGAWKTIALPKATTDDHRRERSAPATPTGSGSARPTARATSARTSRVRSLKPAALLGGQHPGHLHWAPGRRPRRPRRSAARARHATASTKRATFTFTGHDVGWIATRTTSERQGPDLHRRGPGRRPIDLDRTTPRTASWSSRGTSPTLASHTLEIQPVGDGRVDIDGFVVLR